MSDNLRYWRQLFVPLGVGIMVGCATDESRVVTLPDGLRVCVGEKDVLVKGFGESPERIRSSSFYLIQPSSGMLPVFGKNNKSFFFFGEDAKDVHWADEFPANEWIKSKFDIDSSYALWKCDLKNHRCYVYAGSESGINVSFSVPAEDDRAANEENIQRSASWIFSYLACR